MKEKIRNQLLKISLVSIVITLVITVCVFYSHFRTQVFSDLEDCTRLLADMYNITHDVDFETGEVDSDTRITLIKPDGEVMYDSEADYTKLPDHGDREEIKEALEDGHGKSVRKSATFSKSTFYFAVRLNDGNVMRLSKETGSIWTVFFSALPPIFILVVILFVICFIWSDYLTKKLIKPLEELVDNIGNPSIKPEYDELIPFMGALKEQREDILRSATMRQEFTANVSHELKTPLTSISGYAELIETGIASGPEAVRFAGEIKKNSTRLLSLINDIINLSELDDGVKLQLEHMDLFDAAKECVKNLQVNAANMDVNLMLLGSSCIINADRALINEVIYNLCDNAIRYNNKGGNVIVDVSRTMDNKVSLVVKDDGIGIPKEHQDRIFERFYRVDKSRSKETGGTGLGLAIVKHILTSHGAELKLESEVGKGTCITVIFEDAGTI